MEVHSALQYGALGILAMVLGALILALKSIGGKIADSFDRHAKATSDLSKMIGQQEVKALERHHASTNDVRTMVDGIDDKMEVRHQLLIDRLHDLRSMVQPLALYFGRRATPPDSK